MISKSRGFFQGYLNNSEATKDAITTDKWFKTGDIAIRDKDGFYYIVDRRKELIKYKGFQGLFHIRENFRFQID